MTYVMTPNNDILILGFRLDQIYTRAKAREEAINGISRKGVIAYSSVHRHHERMDERGGMRR
jgi:hypothetical protein